MQKTLAKFIVKKCEEQGVDCTLYEDYSGRGMFGNTTTGIVTNNPLDIISVLASVITEYNDDTKEEMEEFQRDLEKEQREDRHCGSDELRQDNLGRDTIIY